MTTLYLDMDGVVANFNSYAVRVLGRLITGDEIWAPGEWNKIASNQRLYRDLDKMPDADRLVQFCRDFCLQNGYALLFLTAIPNKNDVPWSFYDKVLWAQLHYPDIPVMFGPYSGDKKYHCRTGDILIDDRNDNIKSWNGAGGVGILHLGDMDMTILQLKK